ncbi:hypothetical protein AB6846_05860 [Serratia proteamaculans]
MNTLPLLQLTPKRGGGLSEQSLRFIAAHQLTPNVVQQAGDIQTLLGAGRRRGRGPCYQRCVTPLPRRAIEAVAAEQQTDGKSGIAWNRSG